MLLLFIYNKNLIIEIQYQFDFSLKGKYLNCPTSNHPFASVLSLSSVLARGSESSAIVKIHWKHAGVIQIGVYGKIRILLLLNTRRAWFVYIFMLTLVNSPRKREKNKKSRWRCLKEQILTTDKTGKNRYSNSYGFIIVFFMFLDLIAKPLNDKKVCTKCFFILPSVITC